MDFSNRLNEPGKRYTDRVGFVTGTLSGFLKKPCQSERVFAGGLTQMSSRCTCDFLHTPCRSLPSNKTLISSVETMQVARIEVGPKNERYEELCYRHSAKGRCAPYGALSFWDGDEALYRLTVSDDERWGVGRLQQFFLFSGLKEMGHIYNSGVCNMGSLRRGYFL